ncbi:MAG: matrixin family metalloprotease [Gemmatimonadota bacterium]
MPSMKGAEKLAGKAAEILLAGCVAALAGFIGTQMLTVRGTTAHGEAAGAIAATIAAPAGTRPTGTRVPKDGQPQLAGTLASAQGVAPSSAPTGDDGTGLEGGADEPRAVVMRLPATRILSDAGTVREMRRRITAGAEGTYIGELLVSRDSALARWPDRLVRPLRVWVDESGAVEGWSDDFVPAVRDAFDSWSAAGIPIRFDYVVDSASADVQVRFTNRLANGISGKTVWSRDSAWWLVAGDIHLAVEHPSGGTVSGSQMRAIALHEVGHLLGLDHSASVEDIMSARVRVREISDTDRATVRLLYSMPAGSIK